jgi:tetratricopeptide (TPR) repeat protein
VASEGRLLGRDVVVWLRAADRELDPSLAARARVHHPALVQLHEARRAVRGPRDLIGRPYVVADPLPGAALAELLARGERLDPPRLASLALDTLAALETLHALGLSHGAVSTATLRLGPAGSSGSALALDPLRTSPPPTGPARQTLARADLRALAEALYEAATGRRPDPAAPIPLRGLRPDLPAGVERVVLDLLEDGPGARGGPGLAAQARARLAEAAGLEAGPRPGVVEPRFVGRDDALADIAAAVDEAQALAAAGRAAREAAPAGASAAFVLVSAPAGLGKTRLLHEAAAAHARAGARPLLLQAQAGSDAYAPWRAALERAATWSDGAPAKDALAALLSPVLEPLVRHERVARGLLALGARRPLLLLVDDGHRLSEAAAALLLHVARSAATPGAPGAAAVVVASRPAEAARPSPLLAALAAPLAPLHHAVPLAELPAVEAEELAASLLPEGTPRDEVERLARRGGGSPFLLGELAAQLRSAGPGGRAAATAPASVQEALRVRLGRLGRDARALLDALAAVGRPLPAPAIEGVLLHAQAGGPAGRAREARAELDALGLARPTEAAEEGGAGGLALRHGATREVALEALDPARARALAGVVLRALDQAAPLGAGDRARLALVAHEPGAAEAALAAAATDAAPDELLEAASQALPAGTVRARVQRDLARARLRRGAFQGARAAVAAALAEAGEDAALRAEAELIQGDAAFLEGDLRGAAESAGRGRSALDGPPSPAARGLGPLLAKLLALSAKVATQRGDHAEAAARLAEARAAVGSRGQDFGGGTPAASPRSQGEDIEGLRDRLAVDEATAWVLALDRARYAEARARIEAAVRAREAAGDEAGLLHAERALGMHAYYAGDMPRAEACFKAALGRCERVGDPSLAAGLWNNLGLVAREQGALRRAEVALERALDLAERLGQAAVLCRALTNVGRVRRSLGDLRGAARSFRRAAAVAATGGDAVIESAALTELGAARLEAGRPRAALAAIGRGLAIRRARGDAGRVGESCLELGEVWRAAGDPRAALGCAARALALHAALGNAHRIVSGASTGRPATRFSRSLMSAAMSGYRCSRSLAIIRPSTRRCGSEMSGLCVSGDFSRPCAWPWNTSWALNSRKGCTPVSA